MANIIGLKEKQFALKEINKKLKDLKPINDFLGAENPSGLYEISFGTFKSNLLCKDSDTIKAFVFAYKKELVAEIRAQAEKYDIEFDEEEENLLN